MIIQIEIPDTLPEGRRSSFKKGIAEGLIEAATTRTELEHTPEGHGVVERFKSLFLTLQQSNLKKYLI